MLSSAWRWYLGSLSRRPLLTQACSTGVISGVGDVIAQQCIERCGLYEHDWSRTLRFSAVGFIVVGPALWKWFGQLEKIVGTSQTISVALRKMMLDQLCFVPVFFSVLLPTLWLSQGVTLQQIPTRLKQDYVSILSANYKVWPAVQALNFFFIPLHLRVNVANTVAVGWNSYLSWRSHCGSHDPLMTSHDQTKK